MITALRPAMHAAPDISKTGFGYLFYKVYTNSNFTYTLVVISMDRNTFHLVETALHMRVVPSTVSLFAFLVLFY